MKTEALIKCRELLKIKKALGYLNPGIALDVIVKKRIFVVCFRDEIELDRDIVIYALKERERKLEAEIKAEVQEDDTSTN